jgi:6-phosphogluconolactonase (cycloisomerase 2 family)
VKNLVKSLVGAGVVAGLASWVGPVAAGAQEPQAGTGAGHAVFVQTDNPDGNQIVAYTRVANGTLTVADTYDTGGAGGVLNGSVVDHLASQGSLTYDSAHALLYAVNAGSNTVSVFNVNGNQLSLQQVISSGGSFPVSVAVHDNLVYVLNALDASLSGFRIEGGKLHPIEGSTRRLGLTIPTDTSQFTHAPAQVAFSPDGSQAIVTTKANGNDLDVFSVLPDGRLSGSPVVNVEPGTVPFAETFDAAGHLVVANAGPNSLSIYTLNADGTLLLIDSVATGQAATCWVAGARGFFYTSNAGSGSLSGFQDNARGQLSLLAQTSTDAGTVDAAATGDGQYLYVQTGKAGNVDEFRVAAGGSLSPIGSVTVPSAAGGEGIVAA